MAIARLSRVTLLSSRDELGSLLATLIEFEQFHPSKRDGLVQDVGLLLLGSRAHAVYSDAGDLLKEDYMRVTGASGAPLLEFRAHDIGGLVRLLEGSVARIKEEAPRASNDAERQALRTELVAIRETALTVFESLDRIRVYPGLDRIMVLEGFVPTEKVGVFERLVGGHVLWMEPVDKRRPQEPYVPSLLVNPRVISLFESISLAQGVPRYNEVDPTPIVAFIFPFFFGIMFSDVGHGLVLLGFGLFLVYRTKSRYWGQLISTFGVAAALIGFVRGLFFGIRFTTPLHDFIPLPPALTGPFTAGAAFLLLETAIVIGTFHLTVAYAIAFLNSLRSDDYEEALLSHLPTLLLYTSIVPLGLALAGNGLQLANLLVSSASTPVFDQFLGVDIPVSTTARISIPLILASLATLVAGHPISQYRATHNVQKTLKALGTGLAEAVAKPFEFLMNTISYVRLGILLIVGTLLAGLVAGVLVIGPLGIVLAVPLNIVVMAVEGLIVYVQDLRLHVNEWFSKFYFGLGTPFSPLASRNTSSRVVWV